MSSPSKIPPMLGQLGALQAKPSFHKLNTVDNLFQHFYGFQTGQLLISVIEAKNLPKEETFCELVLEKNQKQESQINKVASLSPKWNEEFCFEISDQKAELTINVLKLQRIGKDKVLCSLKLPMSQVVDGNLHEGWFALTPAASKYKTGSEMYLRYQYTSDSQRNRDYAIAKENGSSIMSILMAQDLVILASLCSCYESEELSKALIRLFYSEGQALRLLVQLIYRDIRGTPSEALLFRHDSIATKTVRNFFRMVAPQYLKKAIVPLLDELLVDLKKTADDGTKIGHYQFEISEAHLKSKDDLQPHILHVTKTVQRFLDQIFASVEFLPLNMRKFFSMLRQMVALCFPETQYKVVGSFMFLRFVCPAIATPMYFDLHDDESLGYPETRKVLTLITKIIQHCANQVMDFNDEQLKPFVPLLKSNAENIAKFYKNLTEIPEKGQPDAERSKWTEENKLKCLSLIMGVLRNNLNNVEKQIQKDPRYLSSPANEAQQLNNQFNMLKEILSLEPKFEMPKKSPLPVLKLN